MVDLKAVLKALSRPDTFPVRTSPVNDSGLIRLPNIIWNRQKKSCDLADRDCLFPTQSR